MRRKAKAWLSNRSASCSSWSKSTACSESSLLLHAQGQASAPKPHTFPVRLSVIRSVGIQNPVRPVCVETRAYSIVTSSSAIWNSSANRHNAIRATQLFALRYPHHKHHIRGGPCGLCRDSDSQGAGQSAAEELWDCCCIQAHQLGSNASNIRLSPPKRNARHPYGDKQSPRP